MDKLRTESVEKLLKVITDIEDVDECYQFFEDLCTIKEIQDMAQRLEVALLLNKKENYVSISQKTGASTATISRVNKCLSYGTGGYENAIKKLEKK